MQKKREHFLRTLNKNYNKFKLQKQQKFLEMSNILTQKKASDQRRVSKRRCLSELRQPRQIELFQTIHPPYQKYFNDMSIQNEYEGKIFRRNIHAYLEIFTFNYLVTCFESKNNQNCSTHLDYLYELIQRPQFQFVLPETNSQLRNHSHMNLKNIISQFLNYLSSGIDSVMKSLNKYPLMLEIFTAFFRTLLALGEVSTHYNQILQMQSTFQFLTSYFDLEAAIGDNYIYFTDTNIYACQNNPSEVLMFIPNDHSQDISSFCNKREQHMYKSGISTVNYLIGGGDVQVDSNLKKNRNQKRKKHAKAIYEKISERRISIQNKVKIFEEQKKTQSNRKLIQFTQIQQKKIVLESKVAIRNDEEKKKAILEESSSKFKKSPIKQILLQTQIQNEQNQDKKQQKCQLKANSHYRNKSQFSGLHQSKKQNLIAAQDKTKKNTHTENSKSQFLIEDYFYRPESVKLVPKSKYQQNKYWVSKDVTKQFTSSIILAQMPDPYRTNIKMKKQKAREIRNSAYNLLK